MYVPQTFAVENRANLEACIAEHSFALLVTAAEGRPTATHLPLLLQKRAGEPDVLVGHLAKANPQWRAGGRPGLAVFSGPHAYISPTAYQVERAVPTWNYVAVHVHGQISFFDNPERLVRLLRASVAKYESPRTPPWQWDEQSDYSQKLLREIVGVELTIERIEGAWKLNQNHPQERRDRVIAALTSEGGEQATAIAQLMRNS
jgi:transcriptional regulator